MKLVPSVESGVYFKCTACGKCCTGEQEGYIFVYESDIRKMSEALNLTLNAFAKKYLKIIDYNFDIWDHHLEKKKSDKIMPTLVLDFGHNQDCVFLKKENGKYLCEIYPARPLQCKLFPFWSWNMVTEEGYFQTREDCDGFDCENIPENSYPPEKIIEMIKQERKLEYDYYKIMKKHQFNIYEVYPFLRDL